MKTLTGTGTKKGGAYTEDQFYPPFDDELLERAVKIKFQCLDALKINSDSARYYEKEYFGFQNDRFETFSKLLSEETYSLTNWLDRTKGKELSIRDELIKFKENNIDFLKRQNVLLDSVSLLKENQLDQAIKEKYVSDSLLIFKDSLRRSDSTNNVRARENAAKEEKIKQQTIFLIAVGILLVLAALYFFNMLRIQKKRRKAENTIKEEELKRTRAEMKLLSNLALHHDIDKFIPHLPLYINSLTQETKESLENVVDKFKDFYLATKKLGNSLTNTVKNEIILARKSSEVYLYMARSKTIPHIITNFESIAEIENLEIPKNMLTSFIANSIKHGAIGKESISVMVTVQKDQDEYSFTVEDDGVGFTKLNLENKPSDKGINLILSQVQNYNESNQNYQIQFLPENIRNKPNSKGVVVTFKLIKI